MVFSNSRVLIWTGVVCLLTLSTARSAAQVTTAEIVGTVTDNSGAVVIGAQVTVKNLGTNVARSMATNASGNYVFTFLPVGVYSVTVELTGFKTFTAPSVTLAAGDRARVNASMQLGDVKESVEVVAESAGALQTDTSTIAGLVTNRAVQDLPVNGRNFITLVQLTPGATESRENSLSGGTRPDDRRQTSAVSVNGQPEVLNNYMLDGLDNNERLIGTIGVKPSIDALQEVKVQTSLYPADVGRTGGGVINMVTKSGTNTFHGSLFEFLRNDKFDARDFFNVPQAGNPLAGVKPEYRQNQFGGSIGGPIIKNKLFFFGDYEGLRIVQGRTGQTTLPTPCELGRAGCEGVTQLGNFSDMKSVIYDVTTNPATPFANNIVPLSRINSISTKYAALIPTPAATSCSAANANCQFVSNPLRTQGANTFDIRGDYHFSEKDTLYARHSFNNTTGLVPGLLPLVNVDGMTVAPGGTSSQLLYPGPNTQRQQQLGAGYTHVFTPTLLMQANFGFLKSSTQSLPVNWGVDVNKAFGGPNVNNSEETSGLANVTFNDGGYVNGTSGGLGDYMWLPLRYWDNTFQVIDNLTWVRGSHSFRFGGNIVRRLVDNFQSRWSKAQFTFSAQQTNSTEGGPGGSGGNSFASFLLGYPYDQRRELQLVEQYYQFWEFGGYVEDDWRATPWLTLNLGLRYDIYTPETEANNNLSTFDPQVPKVLAGGQYIQAGKDGRSRSIVNTEYTHFQPRLGLAATLGRGFVLRGGFGMTYYPTQMTSMASMKNPPLLYNWLQSTPLGVLGAAPPTWGVNMPDPTPSSTCLVAACGATSVTSVPAPFALDYRDSRMFQYSVTVEKEIVGNVLSVAWVGNKADRLSRVVPNGDLPNPPMTAGGCGVTSTITLPNPCQPYYNAIPLVASLNNYNTHDGTSNYNALQVTFQRRFSKGLTASGNYTWAHALNNTGSPNGGPQASLIGLWPSNWQTYDYGNSEFDIRHRVALTANYELPFAKSLKGPAGLIASGWQVNGIYSYLTGQPFEVRDAKPQSNIGYSADRPNALPASSSFGSTLDQFFDTSAFAMQAWGTPGNEGRSPLHGPSQRRLDISVFKDFPIKEGMKLQFRCEMFNITNSPSFAVPGISISGWTSTNPATAVPTQAGNFGKITSTSQFYTPRDIQFALKLLF